MIANINLDKIIAHPNNPRKDLGDLTELADSIKATGILQNLTVVPVDIEDYKRKKASKKAYTDEYITIIGHRRSAAARLAGLTEVPCAIVDMDEKSQVATMLLENMQRSDLTVYEQAQGFQLMLDLGEDINSISEKTGFSKTTVRRRVSLLDLDKDKFKEAHQRGATLTDYAELDKIKDVGLKNKVLDSIGTNNFSWELRKALEKEQEAASRAEVIKILETFATKVDDRADFDAEYISSYSYDRFAPPEDADEVQYYYCLTGTDLYLLTESEEADGKEDDEDANNVADARVEREARIAALEAAHKRTYKLRMEFAKAPPTASDAVRHTMMTAAKSMMLWQSWIDEKVFATFFDIGGGFKPSYGAKDDDKRETFNEVKERIFERREFNESHGKNQSYWQNTFTEQRAFFAAMYIRMENPNAGYFKSNAWIADGGSHEQNKTLDRLYSYLCSLGYKMSDEEKALQDGTHELYTSSMQHEDEEEMEDDNL